MRHLIKFLILLCIVFAGLYIYGLFNFQMGFPGSLSDVSAVELLQISNLKYMALQEDSIFISFVTQGKLYAGVVSADDASLLNVISSIKGGEGQQMNWTTAIILGVVFLITLFFPTKKAQKNK